MGTWCRYGIHGAGNRICKEQYNSATQHFQCYNRTHRFPTPTRKPIVLLRCRKSPWPDVLVLQCMLATMPLLCAGNSATAVGELHSNVNMDRLAAIIVTGRSTNHADK